MNRICNFFAWRTTERPMSLAWTYERYALPSENAWGVFKLRTISATMLTHYLPEMCESGFVEILIRSGPKQSDPVVSWCEQFSNFDLILIRRQVTLRLILRNAFLCCFSPLKTSTCTCNILKYSRLYLFDFRTTHHYDIKTFTANLTIYRQSSFRKEFRIYSMVSLIPCVTGYALSGKLRSKLHSTVYTCRLCTELLFHSLPRTVNG